MTLLRFAIRNVRGSARRYAAYFLSSAAAVMIFYLFASFVFHPDVAGGSIYGAAAVGQGLVVCQVLIVMFAFFFVLYSSSAFYRTRKKEFGLLQLFGMTAGQLRKLAFVEQILISLGAIIAGVGLGILFSKLFFMTLTELLQSDVPVRFMIVMNAVWVTAAVFFLLYVVVALVTLLGVGRKSIIDLLRESRKPKRPPAASIWLAILGVLALGAGYFMAFTGNLMTLLITMIPIVGLVVFGTYLLFTQVSVFVLRRMERNRGFYWKHTRILFVSQLMYRMKDNARLMSVSAVLTAVVLTAVGTVYVFHNDLKKEIVSTTPFAVSFEEKGEGVRQVIDPEVLEELFRKHGVTPNAETSTVLLPTVPDKSVIVSRNSEFSFISESDWNEIVLALQLGEKHLLQIEPGETVFGYPFNQVAGAEEESRGERVTFEIAGKTVSYVSKGTVFTGVTNHQKLLWVLDDAEFAELAELVPPAERTVLYGYNWAGWEDDVELIDDIFSQVPADFRPYAEERIYVYAQTQQVTALTLFIGLFVGLLFFFAAGSLLYFKQFTELEEDRLQVRQLTRMGLTPKELRQLTRVQIGAMFFIPFAVGSVHALFAFKMLNNIMSANLWGSAFAVIGGFFVLQLLYYAVTRRMYTRQLQA